MMRESTHLSSAPFVGAAGLVDSVVQRVSVDNAYTGDLLSMTAPRPLRILLSISRKSWAIPIAASAILLTSSALIDPSGQPIDRCQEGTFGLGWEW
jgi:hypothetical protein